MQQFHPQVNHCSKFELNKEFNFSAAHKIESAEAGKCSQLHGHTYFVNLTIVGDALDDIGFLVDFRTLKQLVHERFDHTLLNESADSGFPTTEFMAKAIADLVTKHLGTLPHKPTCVQVVLRETPSSYVVYRPQGGFR